MRAPNLILRQNVIILRHTTCWQCNSQMTVVKPKPKQLFWPMTTEKVVTIICSRRQALVKVRNENYICSKMCYLIDTYESTTSQLGLQMINNACATSTIARILTFSFPEPDAHCDCAYFGTGQSSRSLPHARRIVGSGNENGILRYFLSKQRDTGMDAM